MGELSKHFIEQFHNLPGDTVKEKQQNLFKLLHQTRPLLSKNSEELESLVTTLEAQNHLEKIFRIDFLIYFRRFKELYSEYLEGDEITLSKVAKQEWFFQEAFNDVGAVEFVTNILPSMSYSVKLKTLKRLLVSEEQCDAIFDAVCKWYGIFLATTLLPKCSVNKIRDVLQSNLIKLTVSQLKQLYNKEPDLINVYFEERTKHEGHSGFMDKIHSFLVYVAQKNSEMFAKLFDKYHFNIHLGNRTTKRYIDSRKSDVIDKCESYLKILKKGPMVRRLGNELKYLLFKNISDNPYQLYWENLLQYYPKTAKFDIFKTAYNSTYYTKLGENVDVINEDMLKLMEPVEREKIAKIKLKEEEDDKYLQYVTPEYCLNEFKQRLSQMTGPERSTFILYVTECCILSQDLDVLLQVLEMVAVRFKNDDKNIRFYLFLSFDMHQSIFDQFREEHWKYVLEIIAKANFENEYLYSGRLAMFKYLEYRIKNNKSIRETLIVHNSQFTSWVDGLHYEYIWKKPELCKKIILELIEVGCQKSESSSKEEYDCEIARTCFQFNKKYPKYFINIYNNERILQSIKKTLENNEPIPEYNAGGIAYVICQKQPPDFIKELNTLYFKYFTTFGTLKTCLWFLKHDPKTFQENLNFVLQAYPENEKLNSKKLWRLVKKYAHLEIDQKIVEHFTALLKKEDFNNKKLLVKPLSMLSPSASYVDLAKSYIPTSAKVDLIDEHDKELYALQCEVVKCLHYEKTPEVVLPTALKFCKGDYLKPALSPLYSCVYRLAEIKIKSTLDKLGEENAVSVKKHAMRLGCEVLDKEAAHNFLKNSAVPSLMVSLKYLAKNPSNSIWEIVETKLLDSKKQDLQVIKTLQQISLPLEYKCKYVETTWELCDKYESKETKKIIMNQIHNDVIRELRPEFIYKIIEGSVFKIQEVDDFLVTLLIHMVDDKKLEFLSKIFSHFHDNVWQKKKTGRRSQCLHSFVYSFFKIYVNSDEPDFVTKFLERFTSLFKPVETFEEYVLISFLKMKGKSVEACSNFLVGMNNDLVRVYSRSVINSLANIVKDYVMPHLFVTELEKMQFCYNVFKNKQSIEDYLLVIKLLPQNEPKYVEDFKLYHEIVKGLEIIDDLAVRLQLNLYLK